MRRAIPTALTLIGAALGIAGVALLSPPLLALSLLFDILDGWTARHLGATSDEGARLDWTVDVLLAGGLAVRLGAGVAMPLLALVLVACVATIFGATAFRTSGRAVITVVAMAMAP